MITEEKWVATTPAKSAQPAIEAQAKKRSRFWETQFPPILVIVVVIIAWQLICQWLDVPKYLLPKPTDIVEAAVANIDNLIVSVTKTISASLLGFALSIVLGILGAIVMSLSKVIERSLYPYAVILQTIPIVAIAPIIVIWFGSGLNAIVIIAFIIGFFPMLSNTLIGLNSVDHNMRNLFELYNASSWQTMVKLRLPAAMPYIMGGLKISCTMSVIGAIVGEYIAGIGGGSGGLGYAITVAAARLQTPYLFAVGLASSILGIVFSILVNLFSKWMLSSWHESEVRSEN
ncbi:ABC transporter permease [Brevibacillus sp. B_LB10_24]|uniref:ABC transporter permease n=1 Tax=Brevibacillus sp. B_LB10_24 TaxID=3380645 RepID=UPI0038BB751C